MNPYYVIQGPIVDGETLYWVHDFGWGSLETASHYPRGILANPLPIEGVAVVEFTDGVVTDILRGGYKSDFFKNSHLWDN